MRKIKLYCEHEWEQGDCGSYRDCYRICNRCNTRWNPLYKKEMSTSWWDFGMCRGVYGEEPEVVIAHS